MKKSVAFIGVGNMGARMARRLIDAGHSVHICDTRAEVCDGFRGPGVTVTTKPADCAHADIIVIMVGDAAQISAVMAGAEGLESGLDARKAPVIAIMSTVLPSDCQQLQERLGRDRARIVDAPVSGGLLGAEQGALTIMAGGEVADIDEALPVFEILGRTIFRCGPLGAGQVAKIVNNLIGIANIYGNAEAFDLAARHGLPLETLAPILEVSTGRTFFTEDAANARGNYRAWAESSDVFESLGDIIRKDLSLAASLAAESGIELPILNALSSALAHIPEKIRHQWQVIGTPDSLSARDK